jgi:octaprenyl-diphosphate synthase
MILDASNNGNAVIRIFARTLSDLATGEMLQLQKASSGDTEENDYLRIIYDKTASLFVATAVSASISVGAPDDFKAAVKEYATDLGLAFQIKDDIMDYMGSEMMGKPVGKDLGEQKMTLPLLGALKKVPAEKAEEIRRKVCDIADNPAYVTEVRQFVLENDGIRYANERLASFIDKGLVALAVLPDSKEKEYLMELTSFVAERNL